MSAVNLACVDKAHVPKGPGRLGPALGPSTVLGVNSWELDFHTRAKLEWWVFGVVLHLIWWISGGFRPPGAVAPDIRADSTLIRRFDVKLYCRGRIRHHFDTILTFLLLI